VERSRVTVEFSHLPGQVFEHEANGVYCVTTRIDGAAPDELRMTSVLEALEHALELWTNAGGSHVGFPSPAADHDDQFRLVVPRSVDFDVWPAMFFCSNPRCGHVITPRRVDELPARRRCQRCRSGSYGQLPYFQVHSCGTRRELSLPGCPEHGDGAVGFEDSGSFYTARFRCLSCRRPLGVEFRQCACRLGWRDARNNADRVLTPVTARDSRAFFGHHLTLVSVGGTRLTDALRAPQGVHYALGHYVGTVTSLEGLEDEARGRRADADDAGIQALRELQQQHPDLAADLLATITEALNRQRGDEPELERTTEVLQPHTLEAARLDRRAMERAFLHAECAVDDLRSISSGMRTGGHAELATRLENGLTAASASGIGDIKVVRDFPVALVGYGFTREYPTPQLARLAPLPHGDDDRLPLVAVEARTEGILIELEATTLWHWCARNGWCEQPIADVDEITARAWLLNQTYEGPETGAATAIRRVTHAYSHLLIHALANHSSYSSNSVAEYLLERQASTLIYVAKYTSFNLGGLATLAEQHLQRWIDSATQNAWTCVHDPVCLAERGGCHKCLAVAFGCERFNRGLDRGYLVGGGHQDIREGYLYTARERMILN
jgi:hypothetical protein